MKRLFALLLSATIALCSIGCGSTTADGENSKTDGSSQDVIQSGGEVKNEEIIFGNSPNNLLQFTGTMCFGENRVFYLNYDYVLCSFKPDGSDWQEHCAVDTDKQYGGQSICMNYYNGGIYFMATKDISDTTSVLNICRYDIAKNTVETIYTVEPEGGSGYVFQSNMLIFNDNLCFAYSIAGKNEYVEVIDLTTGKSNSITSGKSGGGTTNFGFDTDGKYLYMIWDGGINEAGMKRVLLSELYDENPEVEKIFDRPYYTASYVLDDGGLYAAVRDKNENTIYGFYSHETLSGNVRELTLKKIAEVSYISYPETEEERINDLGFDTTTSNYILDGARVSVKVGTGKLGIYYSSNLDWRESVLTAEPEYGRNLMITYSTRYYHIGEYDETLYFVLEDLDGNASLHSLTADGKYN